MYSSIQELSKAEGGWGSSVPLPVFGITALTVAIGSSTVEKKTEVIQQIVACLSQANFGDGEM